MYLSQNANNSPDFMAKAADIGSKRLISLIA
jgi:hypothetical protein